MSLKSIEDFFINVGKKIAAFLGILKTDAVNVFTIGINILTALITFIQSPEGLIIEDIVAKFIPAIHVEEFLSTFLPTLFVELKWATAEAGKTTGQIIEDGLTYLASLTTTNKVLQFTSAAASIILWLGSKLGIEVGTPQQVVTAVPSAYATLKETVADPVETEVKAPAIGRDAVAEEVANATSEEDATK